MKTFLSGILLATLLLVGCDRKVSEEPDLNEARVVWFDAEYSLEEYKRMQPGRPIFAVFAPDIDILEQLLRREMEDEVCSNLLKDSNYLYLWYDCRGTDSLGKNEMESLDRVVFPFSVFVDESAETHLFTTPTKKEEIHEFIRNIRKNAEQGAAGNPLPAE